MKAEDIVVFEVDSTKLDKTKLYESDDHNRKYYDCDCWVYEDKIPYTKKMKIYTVTAG